MASGQAHRVPVLGSEVPAHVAGLLGALHEPAMLASADRVILDLNAGAERLLGRPRADLIGRSFRELHASDATFHAIGVQLRESVQTGASFSAEATFLRADGETFLARVSIAPVPAAEGGVAFLGTLQDVTEERAAHVRARLLAEVSGTLAQQSLEPEAILRSLAATATRYLCDYCAVEIFSPDGALRRVELAHASPERREELAAYLARYPPDPAYVELLRAIPRGSYRATNGLTSEQLRAFMRDEEHVRAIESLGLRHALNVPLHGRSGLLGALSFSRARGEPFQRHDISLALELCERAAFAYENAHLHIATRDLEARWRSVVENANAYIYLADAEGRVRFINRMREGSDASQVLGRSLYAWLTPEEAARVRPVYEGVFATGKSAVVTTTAVIRGHTEHYEMRISPVTRDGRVDAVTVTTIDVTQRIEAERAAAEKTTQLREREAQLAAAQALARVGSWTSDPATGVLVWSDENYRIHGIPVGEPVTFDRMLARVHPEDRARFNAVNDEVLRRGEGAAEYRLLLPDGTIRHVHARGRVEYRADGKPLRAVGTTLDITERKLAEAALRESEHRFRTLVTATTHMVWHTDADGMILDMPEWRAFTGQSVDEVKGAGWLQAIHPEDQPRVIAAWLAAFERREIYEVEYRVRSAEGVYRWFLARGVPRLDEQGALVEYIGTWTDITPQKEALQEAETLRLQLAQNEKLGAMGSLVGGVAHEIRTPLTYLANNLALVELASKRILDELPPGRADELRAGLKDRFADAHESIERINRIVEELRRYTRLKPIFQRTSASLSTFVGAAVEIFRATHRGQAIVTDELTATRPILGDRVQLQQVLLNLVQNALESRPADDRILVRAYDAPEGAVLEVIDRGQGIPPAVLARIWDPFFTTKNEGTGLGLAVVRRILDAHGARADVRSSPGEGTTFRVTFPYAG